MQRGPPLHVSISLQGNKASHTSRADLLMKYAPFALYFFMDPLECSFLNLEVLDHARPRTKWQIFRVATRVAVLMRNPEDLLLARKTTVNTFQDANLTWD